MIPFMIISMKEVMGCYLQIVCHIHGCHMAATLLFATYTDAIWLPLSLTRIRNIFLHCDCLPLHIIILLNMRVSVIV